MGGSRSGRQGGWPTIEATASYVLSAAAFKKMPPDFAGAAAGGDTQVSFDADGGGDGFTVLATLVGTSVGAVSASDNFAY